MTGTGARIQARHTRRHRSAVHEQPWLHRGPVTDGAGSLIGIVTAIDLSTAIRPIHRPPAPARDAHGILASTGAPCPPERISPTSSP